MPIGSHIKADIQEELHSQGITCSEENRQVAYIAVQKTLECLSSFANGISEELMSHNLHSEAMVSGIMIAKFRQIQDDFK